MQDLLRKYGLNYSPAPQREAHNRLVSITDCDYLIAQTGSIILSDATTLSRKSYTEPDVLLVLAHTHQIVGGLKEALHQLKEQQPNRHASQITVLTGTTRTYDIEQNTVLGVHGPRQLAVFLIDE